MHIPISPRLLACAEYVHPGNVVADVGCDHGYLGIHLLTKGVAKAVIASDINEGPLQSARHNAEKYGVAHRMSFHLSDGVVNVPRDFDVMVCSGMGADTMVSILEAAPWLKCDRYRLILQCQSKTDLLRRYLSENGWCISAETPVKDGRFVYTVMEVTWAPEAPRLSVGGWYISPALLQNHDPEAKEYCQRIMDGLRLAVIHRGDPQAKQALEELEKCL